MANVYSQHSLNQRRTLRKELRYVCDRVLKIVDFKIICGRRTFAEQTLLMEEGRSKIKDAAMSRHVLINADGSPTYEDVIFEDGEPLSEAVDVIPYPFRGRDWKNVKRFGLYAGIFIGVAAEMGIELEWGGDWDGDGQTEDQSFHDLPHLQIKKS